MSQTTASQPQRIVFSSLILLASLALAYVPIPGIQRTIVVVSGSELQETLEKLEPQFEAAHPNLDLDLKFQGSQDMVNNYIDDQNDFVPTVLIPANGEILDELSQRWQAQNDSEPFYETPRPIAKTMLVGVVWPERGKALFPNGQFQWSRLQAAMESGSWEEIGGNPDWGSFDFAMTDPTRSNSGQLTLNLWAGEALGSRQLSSADWGKPAVASLFALVKRSVYLPPRSTDILLQEFITRGPNDMDVATVYESIALHRWPQSNASQGQPYQIYYLNPTVETVSTAAIARRNVDANQAKAAQVFLDFLLEPEQQSVFVEYGFRPAIAGLDLQSVPNSPWNQQIPGAETAPATNPVPPPSPRNLREIRRLWQRAN